MLNALLSRFERLVDPYPETAPHPPPRRFSGFLWACTAGLRPYLLGMTLLTAVIGGAFALIREILDGRHGPNPEAAFARHVLCSLGIRPDEALALVTQVAEKLND